MPHVSVVIPCYNQARFVVQAVGCALTQTYADLEVIVVDDGSTDNPHTALAPYQQHIQFIRQENQGLSAARNAGYRAASGEYLLFLDSDDILLPQSVAHHIQALETNQSHALTYAAWQQISEDGSQLLGEVRPAYEGIALEKLLLRQFFFFASAAVIRRTSLEQVGLFDESLTWGEDADLWLRLAQAGFTFGYIDEPLMKYRIHSNSMTSRIHPGQVLGWCAVLDKFFANPQLPPEIQMLKAEAYSILHFETAGRYYRNGQIQDGQQQIQQAFLANPQVKMDWVLEWAAGTALDPRTPDPNGFIDLVFNDLATHRKTWSGLRNRAKGRYHQAAAFAAYKSREYPNVRKHLLPAFAHDPQIVANRGFWRIVIESMLNRSSRNG